MPYTEDGWVTDEDFARYYGQAPQTYAEAENEAADALRRAEFATAPQKTMGRPRKYAEGDVRTSIHVPDDVYSWLKAQPDGVSAAVVALVRVASKKSSSLSQFVSAVDFAFVDKD